MPLNDATPPQSREEFCLALKATRERKGITLDEIASTTKIPASVFAALERGDLRRWPKGLFRRSFFRDYARAIGLPGSDTCDEFVRLFPDDEGAPVAKGADPPVNESAAAKLEAEGSSPAPASWVDAASAACQRVADAMSGIFASAAEGTDEPDGEPAMREWVTDARRVGPPRPRGLRVRIKLPH
jgi:hypothetical protein